MAKAVTLKNTNNEEIYPVTDAALVNGQMSTGQIADEAVTTDKLDDEAVSASKIIGGESVASLAAGGLVELVGTPPALWGQGSWAWKFADGRLINFQRYKIVSASTVAWGGVYSKDAVMTPVDYAVPFISMPAVSATSIPQDGTAGNHWLATDTAKGASTLTHPPAYQPVRGSSGSISNIYIDIIAYGFWK